MKIKVKKDLCCGAALCVMAAPDVYRLDDLGYNDSDGDTVSPDRAEEARRGENACPERAITLIES